jgi:hypothetical protein
MDVQTPPSDINGAPNLWKSHAVTPSPDFLVRKTDGGDNE